jgi:hypothetical protein
MISQNSTSVEKLARRRSALGAKSVMISATAVPCSVTVQSPREKSVSTEAGSSSPRSASQPSKPTSTMPIEAPWPFTPSACQSRAIVAS